MKFNPFRSSDDDDAPGIGWFKFPFPWLVRPAKIHDDRYEAKAAGSETMSYAEIDESFDRAALLEIENGYDPKVAPHTAKAFARLTVYASRPIIRLWRVLTGKR